jgi:hypothetical protein
MNRNTILVWAVIVLAVINIATIGTIFYHVNTNGKANDTIQLAVNDFRLNNSKIAETLGLTQTQSVGCKMVLNDFRQVVRKIQRDLNMNRSNLYLELQNENPDTLVCNQYSTEIGRLHKELKMETSRFYLQLKSRCPRGKEEQLHQMLAPMFNAENSFGNAGNGNKHRYRGGRGNR